MPRTARRAALPAVLLTTVLVAGTAQAASADPPAEITLGAPAGVITLPADDGVRDTTTVTLSSTADTTVALTFTKVDGGEAITKPQPDVSLTANVPAEVVITVADLPAGLVRLHATPAGGGADQTTDLTVGSGVVQDVALSLSRTSIFTWSGSTARTTTATVSAQDETHLAVPFQGTVAAKIGTTARSAAVSSTDGAGASATFAATSFPTGTGTVVAKVKGAHDLDVTSPPASFSVNPVAVTSVKLGKSVSSVYPTKDGYRDSVRISLTTRTTTGGAIPVKGTVTISRKGKTIKTWKVTSSKAWAATWNGKVGSRTVYGTYTITASLKGPQGVTKKTSTTIKVVKGHLVSRSLSVTTTASRIFSSYYPYDQNQQGYCALHSTTVECLGYDLFYDETMSLATIGGVGVPAKVQSAQKYGSASVRMTLSASVVVGTVAWGYARSGSSAKSTLVRLGSTSPGWLALPATTKRVDTVAVLGPYSTFWANKVKVEYRYKVLVK